jgi:transcriptional regulator with XRE-family HTH domain
MELHERIRQLRMQQGLTQGQVAEYLCVSAQSVSKWERGLVEPDLHTLPRLAVLFHTSTDTLLGMNELWEASDRQRFLAQLKDAYYKKGDKEGTWNLLVNQVALHPDDYDLYIWLMLLAYRAQMCTPGRVEYLIALTRRLEGYCGKDEFLYSAYRYMTQVCSVCQDPLLRAKAEEYYKKIPCLRDSREVYASYVYEGEKLAVQQRKALLRAGDIAVIMLRRLIPQNATDEERLLWYERVGDIYHGMIGDDFAGFYEGQLLIAYAEIVLVSTRLGLRSKADETLERLLYMIDRHILAVLDPESVPVSSVVTDPYPKQFHSLESITLPLLDMLLKAAELQEHHARIGSLARRYREVFEK